MRINYKAMVTCSITILICMAFISGCTAGSRGYLIAPTVRYPVSFSPIVRDANGNILKEENIEVVGKFSYTYTTIHMFSRILPLTKVTQDISEPLEKQIEEANGEAVINLIVIAKKNEWNWFPATLSVGVFPGYSSVEISGDIVRQKRTSFKDVE